MKRLCATAIAFVFGLLLTANVQQLFAQDTMCACTHKENGKMRLVSDASQCKKVESCVCWNVQGPEGPQGECDCLIIQEQLDEIYDRIEYLARFTDMGDGTIRDNSTGLIWLKNANCFGLQNWSDAMDAANSLANGQCGLTDSSAATEWGLPTKTEWEAFMSPAYDNPALVNTVGYAQWSEGDAFIGVQSNNYWSSTDDFSLAFAAHIDDGYMFKHYQYRSYYVWPVRSDN